MIQVGELVQELQHELAEQKQDFMIQVAKLNESESARKELEDELQKLRDRAAKDLKEQRTMDAEDQRAALAMAASHEEKELDRERLLVKAAEEAERKRFLA